METVSGVSTPLEPQTSRQTGSLPTALDQSEFLNIMIAELTNQDPLEPLDNQQFLNQLVQIQTLQATTDLTNGIESLLLGQQIASAGSLIGQQVVGTGASGNPVEGVVDRVLVNGDEVILGVGEETLPLNAVTQIVNPNDES